MYQHTRKTKNRTWFQKSVATSQRRLLLIALITFSALAFWRQSPGIVSGDNSASAELDAVRDRVQARSSYSFSSDILQITIPEATLANIGNSSQEERMYLTGDSDLRSGDMHMRLFTDAWADGGSVLIPESGIEVETVDGITRGRQGNGVWEEMDDFTQGFAPEGDFLAYLVASTDPIAHEPETRSGITFTRYSFDIDGPAFAEFLRQQMQTSMQESGQLAHGMNVQTSPIYAGMTGSGELWIAEDGLPLKQILNLRFPEESGERMVVQVKVDFSNYGDEVGLMALLSNANFLRMQFQSYVGSFLQLSGSLLFVGALYVFRTRRFIEHGIAYILIVSMVLTPLLSAVQPTHILQVRAAHAQEQEADQEENEAIDALRELHETDDFDPLADPAEAAEDKALKLIQPPTDGTVDSGEVSAELNRMLREVTADADGDGLSDELELELGTNPGNADTDGDNISDFQELGIGTMPIQADSDGDMIDDDIEIAGYSFGGQQWYSDPLQADSNNDGLSDYIEAGVDAANGITNSLLDTDNDGTPDMFTDDNDGDGVIDRLDTSPSAMSDVYSESNRLELTIDGLAVGKATSADFQIRPTNDKHLWYAFNVLDWPMDEDGQIQDWNGGTFKDKFGKDANGSPIPGTPESQGHGDMQLTPMLEIEIMGSVTNLPSDLAAYNLTVTDIVDANKNVIGKKVYLPLSLVNDQKSGARVAFAGSLPLMPAANWGNAHKIRMVWAVQMLLDICAAYDVDNNCTDEELDKPLPIHTYDDDFTLTGLIINEDLGVASAIVYEDPALDPDIHVNDYLWTLVDGFDSTFLNPRPTTNDYNNMTPDEVHRRFDSPSNATDAERWGLDDRLKVEYDSFDSADYAAASITMTRTQQIITPTFNSHWSVANPVTPTLLYMQESQFRSVSLDQYLHPASGQATFAGNALTIDFSPASGDLMPEKMRSMKWTAYCAEPVGNTPEWGDCGSDYMWDELDRRFGPTIAEPGDTPDMALGRLVFLKMLYMSIAQGISTPVESEGATLDPNSLIPNPTDPELRDGLGKNGGAVAKEIATRHFHRVNAAMESIGKNVKADVLGGTKKGAIATLKGEYAQWTAVSDTQTANQVKLKKGAIGLAAFVLVAAVAFGILAEHIWPGNADVKLASKLVMASVTLAIGVIYPIYSSLKLASTLVSEGAKSLSAALVKASSTSSAYTRAAAKAAIVGAIIIIAVSWGFFINSIVSGGVSFGSPEFNRALAAVIATTIVTIVLAILSANPIGALITAVLALIDLVIVVVCAIQGKDSCDTVTGEVTKFLAKVLYSYDLMIEIDRSKNKELEERGAPDLVLNDPSTGYISGTQLTLSVPVTTSIYHRKPQTEDFKIAMPPYPNLYFKESTLRSSSFIYSLTNEKAGLDADRGTMENAWDTSSNGSFWTATLHKGTTTQTPTLTNLTRGAGINVPFDYYYNSAYAIPAYECWLIPIPFIGARPICYLRTKDSSASVLTKGPVRDIFPETLDGFMAATPTGNGGQRLNWDPAFPTIYDYDGDGLIVSEKGGVDPNDTLWDSDGDGLSDMFELQQRDNGVDISPVAIDTDGDTLTDAEEMAIGTNPARRDSDNDGLDDNVEVNGWSITFEPYQAAGTWLTDTITPAGTIVMTISSDPTERDADGDSIPDDAEKALNDKQEVDRAGRPYNPNTYNIPPLQIDIAYDVPHDPFVGPFQLIPYTSTVSAFSAFERGTLEVQSHFDSGSPGAPTLYNLPAFTANTSSTVQTDQFVSGSIPSQNLIITSTATARVTNDNPEPGNWVWSPLITRTLSSANGAPWSVNSTWTERDSGRSYLHAFPTSDQQAHYISGRGDIVVQQAVGTGQPAALDVDYGNSEYARNETAPDLTCNDNGVCLSVWAEEAVCARMTITSMTVRNAGDPGGNAGIEPVIRFVDDLTNDVPASVSNHHWMWDVWQQLPGGGLSPNQTFSPSSGGVAPWRVFCEPNSLDPDGTGPLQGSAGGYLKMYEIDGNSITDWDTEPIGSGNVIRPQRQGSSIVNFQNANIDIDLQILMSKPTVAPFGDQRFGLRARFVNTDGTLAGGTTIFTPSDSNSTIATDSYGNFNPSIATDGENFLVAWNRKQVFPSASGGTVHSFVQTQLYGPTGVPIGSTQSFANVSSKLINYADTSVATLGYFDREPGFNRADADYTPSVIWAGDRYRVAWISRNGAVGKIEAHDITLSGSRITSSFHTIATHVYGFLDNKRFPPQLAYDPIRSRVMVVYTNSSFELVGKVYEQGQYTPEWTHSPIVDTGGFPDSPSVAFYPKIQGWLVSWFNATTNRTKFYPLFSSGFSGVIGSVLETEETPDHRDSARPLSCAGPDAAPFMHLAFEEYPGDMTFAGTMPTRNQGVCSSEGTCPVVGVQGADTLVKPQSDRALYFTGNADRVAGSFWDPTNANYDDTTDEFSEDFTFAIWVKPDGFGSGQTLANSDVLFRATGGQSSGGASVTQFGMGLNNAGKVVVGVGNQSVASNIVISDGSWHHVAMTRRASDGNVRLYIDGLIEPAAPNGWTFSATGSLGAQHDLDIGGFFGNPYYSPALPQSGTFQGAIDEFQAFTSVLSGLSIMEIKNLDRHETQNSGCLVSMSTNTGIRNYSVALEANDEPRGFGPLRLNNSVEFIVDADAPVSSFTSVTTTTGTREVAVRYFPIPASGMTTAILGGNSVDGTFVGDDLVAGAGVDFVDIQVNGGSAERANGSATWSHSVILTEAVHDIQAVATDVLGNQEIGGANILIVGDGTAPTVTFDPLPQDANPTRTRDGGYMVPMSGVVTDPMVGSKPGSGVKGQLVDFQLTMADGTELGWQNSFTGVDTTDSEVFFYLEYAIPEGVGDPTGTYTATARVIDGVGNSAEYESTLSLALPEFEARVNQTPLQQSTITDTVEQSPVTQTITIDGVVTSTQGINMVEAAFVPIEQLAVLSGTVGIYHFDERDQYATHYFADASNSGNDGYCAENQCPDMLGDGAINTGALFGGSSGGTATPVLIPETEALRLAESFTLQAWVKTAQPFRDIFSKFSGTLYDNGFQLTLDGSGNPELFQGSSYIVKDVNASVTDNLWHHVVLVVDRDAAIHTATIYVDGVNVGTDTIDFSIESAGALAIGGQEGSSSKRFVGNIDEVMIWNHALQPDEILAAKAMRDLVWQNAAVTRRASRDNGGGRVTESAAWQTTVPTMTEGFHRIDIRLTDNDGRRWQIGSDWATIIDTLAPRLEVVANPTNRTYLDESSGAPRYDIDYTVTATDLHLDGEQFASVCDENLTVGDRGYEANDLSWAEDLFPDFTWRDSLGFSCHKWADAASPTFDATVCDIYGNCTTASTMIDTSSVPTGQTAPIIIAPLNGTVVQGSDLPRSRGGGTMVDAQVAAAVAPGASPIRYVRVFHGGTGGTQVALLSYTQAENKRRVVETVTLDLPGQATYQLAVTTEDWLGVIQNSQNVNITLDTDLPSGTLNADPLTEADALGGVPSVMRFSGLAIDTLEVATVQLSVDGGAFVDVTLNADESWNGAYFIGDGRYGDTLQVTVRFIDKSGAFNDITESILLDIEEPTAAVPTALALTEMQAAPATGILVAWMMAIVLLAVTVIFRPKRTRPGSNHTRL